MKSADGRAEQGLSVALPWVQEDVHAFAPERFSRNRGLPMRVWVYAFWKAAASKKGISALQLSREMEITHKSALFVLRRIRHGLSSDADAHETQGRRWKLTKPTSAARSAIVRARRRDRRTWRRQDAACSAWCSATAKSASS